jgi:putative addiction module antidote
MLTAKVRKIGNSLGIVIPKEALARMKVEEGGTLFLTESPEGYRLTPYDEGFERQMEAAERIMREDRDVLRELAKR